MSYKDKIEKAFQKIRRYSQESEESNQQIEDALTIIQTNLMYNETLRKANYHIELINDFIAIGGIMMVEGSDYSQVLRDHFEYNMNMGLYENGELKFVKAILEFINDMENENEKEFNQSLRGVSTTK